MCPGSLVACRTPAVDPGRQHSCPAQARWPSLFSTQTRATAKGMLRKPQEEGSYLKLGESQDKVRVAAHIWNEEAQSTIKAAARKRRWPCLGLQALIIPTLRTKRQRLSRSKAAKGAKLESGSSSSKGKSE